MANSKSNEALVYELMMSVRKLTRSTLMFQYAVAEKMNLNATDAECIDFLMEIGPSTAGDLARVTRLTTGAITNVIDRLEKAGLVRRESDPKDRRKVIIRYLPGKHEKTKRYYDAMAADVFNLFSTYGASELKLLLKHSKALTEIFHGHAEKIFKK